MLIRWIILTLDRGRLFVSTCFYVHAIAKLTRCWCYSSVVFFTFNCQYRKEISVFPTDIDIDWKRGRKNKYIIIYSTLTRISMMTLRVIDLHLQLIVGVVFVFLPTYWRNMSWNIIFWVYETCFYFIRVLISSRLNSDQ